jgi:hypothetical protein
MKGARSIFGYYGAFWMNLTPSHWPRCQHPMTRDSRTMQVVLPEILFHLMADRTGSGFTTTKPRSPPSRSSPCIIHTFTSYHLDKQLASSTSSHPLRACNWFSGVELLLCVLLWQELESLPLPGPISGLKHGREAVYVAGTVSLVPLSR